MFYFGYVSKEQFIKRLRRELRRASTKIEFNQQYCCADTLVINTQTESAFVLVVRADYADLGNAIHIQVDFCEIQLVKETHRFDLINPVVWQSRLHGIYERKKLRDYCRTLSQLIHEHVSEVNNVMPSEFFESSSQ